MPIPENPQSRSEQYLNAIATGDNSGLPEFPQSRMEQYLEVIAQNGGGGGGGGGGVLVVTITETTDENENTIYVVDKTAGEIIDAMPLVYRRFEQTNPGGTVTEISFEPCSPSYKVTPVGYSFTEFDYEHNFRAETLNDYPHTVAPSGDDGGAQ